jgi:hypothetical protein
MSLVQILGIILLAACSAITLADFGMWLLRRQR